MTDLTRADQNRAAREWAAEARNWAKPKTGNGWIHTAGGTGYPILQGWRGLWAAFSPEILDWYTSRFTAFDSFTDMLNAAGRFRPAISTRNWRGRFLADAYDQAQHDRNDSRRARRITKKETADHA